MPANHSKEQIELIAEIKKTLALAESGRLTNIVIVGMGPELYHRTYSVPKAEDMATVIGEVSMFKTEMELIVMGNRTQQHQNRGKGIIGAARPPGRGLM